MKAGNTLSGMVTQFLQSARWPETLRAAAAGVSTRWAARQRTGIGAASLRRYPVLAPVALSLSALLPMDASGEDWKAAEVVTSYVSGTSPTLILGFDNNLDICLALQEPGDEASLRARGLPVLKSQLVLLQLWNIVRRTDGGGLVCNLPVIAQPDSGRIASLSLGVADRVLDAVQPQIEAFSAAVGRAGWSDNLYTLLGSYVLDGLVWDALQCLGAIGNADPAAIPSGSDFWSGVAWITLPPQSLSFGTNSFDTARGTLHAAWTPEALATQELLNSGTLREELVALATGSHEAPLSEPVARLGLSRIDTPGIPLIAEGDSLCRAGSDLAVRIGRSLLEAEGVRDILELTGIEDPSVAMIMAYHWVYPAILSRLEETGLQMPPLLTGTPGAPLAPCLYVTPRESQCGLSCRGAAKSSP